MLKRKGFTLIELLVVISIIALLVSILMPALNRARQQATAAVCLGNQKALISSWLMYQTDNGDKLVGGVGAGFKGQNPYNDCTPGSDSPWICAPTVEDTNGGINHRSLLNGAAELSSIDAQRYRKFGIELGELWKYNKTVDVYHCPGDKNFKKNPPNDAFVSYAITGAMNGEDIRVVNNNAGWNGIKPYMSSGQIRTPAEKMVFVEEATQGQNYLLGSFQLFVNSSDPYNLSTWWDYMAVWHNKRGTLSFADGHAEITQWESQATLDLAELETRIGFSPTDQYCQNNMDLKRIVRWYGGLPK